MQCENKAKCWYCVCLVLVIIGALNWGLVGLFKFNLVTFIIGDNVFSKLIFIVVAIAGIGLAIMQLTGCCKKPESNN